MYNDCFYILRIHTDTCTKVVSAYESTKLKQTFSSEIDWGKVHLAAHVLIDFCQHFASLTVNGMEGLGACC